MIPAIYYVLGAGGLYAVHRKRPRRNPQTANPFAIQTADPFASGGRLGGLRGMRRSPSDRRFGNLNPLRFAGQAVEGLGMAATDLASAATERIRPKRN